MQSFSAPVAAILGLSPDAAGILVGATVATAAALLGSAVNALAIVAGRLPPFIATLGTLSIFRSSALFLADSGTLAVDNPAFAALGGATALGIPLPASCWSSRPRRWTSCWPGPCSDVTSAPSARTRAWRRSPASARTA